MGNKLLILFFSLLSLALFAGGYFAYNEYKLDSTKTEVTDDGRLRIVYPFSDGGFYFNFRISDEGVIKKTSTAQVGGSSGKQGAFFTPVAEGKADIYTVWVTDPISRDYQAELFHVTVDSGLKVSYKSERIAVREYITATGQELFGFSE